MYRDVVYVRTVMSDGEIAGVVISVVVTILLIICVVWAVREHLQKQDRIIALLEAMKDGLIDEVVLGPEDECGDMVEEDVEEDDSVGGAYLAKFAGRKDKTGIQPARIYCPKCEQPWPANTARCGACGHALAKVELSEVTEDPNT